MVEWYVEDEDEMKCGGDDDGVDVAGDGLELLEVEWCGGNRGSAGA